MSWAWKSAHKCMLMTKDEFNFGGKFLSVKYIAPSLCITFFDPSGLAVSNSSKNSCICNSVNFVRRDKTKYVRQRPFFS